MAIKHADTKAAGDKGYASEWNKDHVGTLDHATDLTNVTADQHHARQHSVTSTSDHISTATSGRMLKADANGLPIDATNTDAQVSSAVTASHARSHALDSTSDHSIGSLTNGRIVKNNGTKLVNATNTDAEVADAVTKKHTQGTDTTLGAMAAAINMNTHQINNVTNPTLNQDAATKKYVDDKTYPITYQTVQGTTDINTTSETYVDMSQMTLTVGVAGTYLIIASVTIEAFAVNQYSAGSMMQILVNAGSVKKGGSKTYNNHALATVDDISQICLTSIQSLAINDVVKLQWKTLTAMTLYNYASSGDASRTLTIIKLA